MVSAIGPVCSLTAVTFRAPAPPLVSRVSSLSQGGPPSTAAAVVMSPVTARAGWQTVLWSVMVTASPIVVVCVDLAGGGHCGGWDHPVGGGFLGRCSDATGRVVGDVVGVSCSGYDCDCVGVGGLLPRVGCGPSSLDRVPVGERALPDVLGWAGDVGDRSSGGGDAVSTDDSKGSPTGNLDRPSRGVGVGGGTCLITAGDLRVPCPGCDGRGAAERCSLWDGTNPNCGAGCAIRPTSCCGGEAPDGCLLFRSPVLAAARVRALVLVEMRSSVCSPVASPRRSWGLRVSCRASPLTGPTSIGSLLCWCR